MLMSNIFIAKALPYNLYDSNNLLLPRARTSLCSIDTHKMKASLKSKVTFINILSHYML